MRLPVLLALSVSLLPLAAYAQMNSMTVTSDRSEEAIMENSKAAPIPSTGYIPDRKDKDKSETADEADDKGSSKDKEKKASQSDEKEDLKPLPAPKLTPAKDLKPWSSDDKLFTARGNPDRIRRVLADFVSQPGRVGPAGLFEVAELYREQGDMKLAARYYYAAQLRARFDYFRWPGRGADDKNPYYAMSQTAATMGGTIGAWATNSYKRLSATLDDVREWDAATPYDYHPGHDIPTGDNVPKEDEWPKLLDKARDQFFQDGMGIAGALKALGQ